MKIDLDELERKVENTEGNRCGCAVTLALIARIRELEVIAKDYAASLAGEGCGQQSQAILAIVEEGVQTS